MAILTAALIAAPIIYDVVKSQSKDVQKFDKKVKDVTGFSKLEKKSPEAALATELLIDYAIFKGAGKVSKGAKVAKTASKAKKTKSVSKSVSAARKRKIFVAGGKGTKRVTVAKTTLKSGTKYTISRGTLASGRKTQTVLKTRKVNRFTGQLIKTRSKRTIAKQPSLIKTAAKSFGKGGKDALKFAKGNKKFVLQSWAIQDALINLNLLSGSDLVFDL